jgi:hypothetical protein
MVDGDAWGIEHHLFYFPSHKPGLTLAFQVHETFPEGPLVVTTSAINFQFFSHRKCLDLIFIYLPGLMVSSGNDRILLQSDFTDS